MNAFRIEADYSGTMVRVLVIAPDMAHAVGHFMLTYGDSYKLESAEMIAEDVLICE